MKGVDRMLTKVHGETPWLETWSRSQVAIVMVLIIVLNIVTQVMGRRLDRAEAQNQKLRLEVTELMEQIAALQ